MYVFENRNCKNRYISIAFEFLNVNYVYFVNVMFPCFIQIYPVFIRFRYFLRILKAIRHQSYIFSTAIFINYVDSWQTSPLFRKYYMRNKILQFLLYF